MKAVFTEGRKKRLTRDWARIAKEPVEVEKGEKQILGYCSETGCQRLQHYYQGSPKVSIHRCDLTGRWFLALKVSF